VTAVSNLAICKLFIKQNLLLSSLTTDTEKVHCTCAYRKLVGEPEEKRPLGRPRHWWMDNIKTEIGWDGMDWIDLAEDRGPVEVSCEHGDEPSGSLKCWEILE
jgi:hypothetical protein